MEKNWEKERLNNKKDIFFILDSFEYKFISINTIDCYSYLDTEEAIKNNYKYIRTYDLLHLSFDLLELGYRIYLVKCGKCLEVYPGMWNSSGKDIRFGHNLRRLLLGGFFDNMLDLNRNKFYYDNSKSTAELLAEELTKEKFDILSKVADATIGIDIPPVKAMTREEAKIWHETHAYYDKDGHFIISPDPVEYDGINKIKPNIKN